VNRVLCDIICQQIVLFAARPYIALLEEVGTALLCDQNPYADVKLPFVDKQRHLHILLDYEAPRPYVRGTWHILSFFLNTFRKTILPSYRIHLIVKR